MEPWLLFGLGLVLGTLLILTTSLFSPATRVLGRSSEEHRFQYLTSHLFPLLVTLGLMVWAVAGLWRQATDARLHDATQPFQDSTRQPEDPGVVNLGLPTGAVTRITATPMPTSSPRSSATVYSATETIDATIDVTRTPQGIETPPPTSTSDGSEPSTPSGYQPFYFTVGPDNTLKTVSRKSYGNPELWTIIADANPGIAPDPDAELEVGILLFVPAPP